MLSAASVFTEMDFVFTHTVKWEMTGLISTPAAGKILSNVWLTTKLLALSNYHGRAMQNLQIEQIVKAWC